MPTPDVVDTPEAHARGASSESKPRRRRASVRPRAEPMHRLSPAFGSWQPFSTCLKNPDVLTPIQAARYRGGTIPLSSRQPIHRMWDIGGLFMGPVINLALSRIDEKPALVLLPTIDQLEFRIAGPARVEVRLCPDSPQPTAVAADRHATTLLVERTLKPLAWLAGRVDKERRFSAARLLIAQELAEFAIRRAETKAGVVAQRLEANAWERFFGPSLNQHITIAFFVSPQNGSNQLRGKLHSALTSGCCLSDKRTGSCCSSCLEQPADHQRLFTWAGDKDAVTVEDPADLEPLFDESIEALGIEVEGNCLGRVPVLDAPTFSSLSRAQSGGV